jgi:hypothetical protein
VLFWVGFHWGGRIGKLAGDDEEKRPVVFFRCWGTKIRSRRRRGKKICSESHQPLLDLEDNNLDEDPTQISLNTPALARNPVRDTYVYRICIWEERKKKKFKKKREKRNFFSFFKKIK